MKKLLSALALTLVLAGAVAAQEKAEARIPRKPPTPLRVQVVFLKYQGEKKVSSLPYTLSVNADDEGTVRLRAGINVPLVTRLEGASQLLFKSVGTNIGCSAESLEDGRYKLNLSADQSSIYSAEGPISWAVSDAPLGKQTVLRDFSADLSTVLRDGQTVQYAAATDPLTGETVKVEVTLSSVK